MTLASALEALKRKDFASARTLIAAEDALGFTIQHFLIKCLAEMAMKDWAAALPTLLMATTRFPDHELFWLNRGLVEENLEMLDAAIASQGHCVALNPARGEAYGNLSNLYRKQKRFAQSEAMALLAVDNKAPKGQSLSCLGLALGRQGKYVEARKAFDQALHEEPHNASIYANLANLEVELFHFEEAWRLFKIARTLDDREVVRHDEGLARLLVGDYEEGWKLFEARVDIPYKMRLNPTCPRWSGEPLHGKKLLITAEQGLGDVINFCRYGVFLSEGELVWAVPKNLVRLLSGTLRGTVVYEKDPVPVCDYYIPLLSLPLATQKPSPDIWRLSQPYLKAPLTPSLPSGSHKRKIGLVWAGSPTHDRDHERSIPLKQFAPFLNSITADYYAPFIGHALDQIGSFSITRLDHLITDFADTAALLKQMDCLITVDTAVAHVAAALGIKTYILLPYCPDWRWGISGNKTDWYPSMVLVRQEKYGDWKSVIQKLATLFAP